MGEGRSVTSHAQSRHSRASLLRAIQPHRRQSRNAADSGAADAACGRYSKSTIFNSPTLGWLGSA